MRRASLGLLLALLVSSVVAAQPVYDHLRIIAPAAPGGGWDQTARAMQQALQTEGIVKSSSVENIAGAAGDLTGIGGTTPSSKMRRAWRI
jgi:putative tricarboxylic transport membrane protein